jgi:hypothetical protein
VKRRIILGTYALSAGYYDAYYGSAQKVRTLIQRDFDAAFAQVDVIATPSAPTTAFKLGEKIDDPLQMYLNDVTTIPVNLAGVPGISIPSGLAEEDGLPVGIQFIAPARQDARLYRVGAAAEACSSTHGVVPCWTAPRCWEGTADGQGRTDGLRRRAEAVRAGARLRGARRTQHRDEDVLAGGQPGARREPRCCPQHARGARRYGPSGFAPGGQRDGGAFLDQPGLALGCQIAPSSRFARKNYFYPDLGKNYQISQYDEPIAFEGQVEVELTDGTVFEVPIERAHMEEDAGKLTHVGGSTGRIQGAEYSLVDYNRAGVPLVEIVTKPIFGAEHRAPELAAAYVRAIRDVVLSLGISEARMERGNLRCDANVSLRPRGQEKLGTRTETKNVNSMRSVERAVRYEIQRQAAILAAGGTITQETRHWHEDTGTTSPGRPKSDADDYRYFPEPDLLPVAPSGAHRVAARRAAGAARRASAPPEGRGGFADIDFQGIVNAGLLAEVEATVAAGRRLPPRASGG